jgi:lipid-A-disaccharide synthase
MKPPTIMVVAGDPSGDAIAADLVKALGAALDAPRFIGAGGPKMAAAGVPLSFDLTAEAVIGVSAPLKKLPRFLRLMRALRDLAAAEKPELVILVDFQFFNGRLARAIRAAVRRLRSSAWQPRIVQYVSPQVWASRPGRADKLARDIDLLLCLFPFEKEWYAARTPRLRVECVGHPMFDRFPAGVSTAEEPGGIPAVVLLPGSRPGELRRHLPVIMEAARLIEARCHVQFRLVAPDEAAAATARAFQVAGMPAVETQTGGLARALSAATLAIASTGTVTLECAYFGVPTVALYKTSLLTYQIARRIVRVNYLAMPNLLAGEALYPEFIQNEATGENIANAALQLLDDPARRAQLRVKLRAIIATLGGPGATSRAVAAILKLTLANAGSSCFRV